MSEPEAVICPKCRTLAASNLKRTFLGFRRGVCPSCKSELLLPMTSGYRIATWGVVAFFALGCIAYLLEGKIYLPGLVPLALCFALVKDGKLRRLAGQSYGRDGGSAGAGVTQE